METSKQRGCKLFNVIVEDRGEWENQKCWVMGFLMPTELEDPEKALRAAVDDFCKSPAGQKVISDAGGNFNWGDVMACLPNEYVLRHGMIPCTR